MDKDAQAVAALCIAAVVIGLVVYGFSRRPRRAGKWTPPQRYEIARIEEDARLSGGGIAAGLLLALNNLFFGALLVFGSANAIQQASLGTAWIALNVLWGVCMLEGIKRTYIVTREAPPPDPPTA